MDDDTAERRVCGEGCLKGLRRVPVHLITDLAEEDFRVDTIPHLGARDQGAVLARKLSQIFRNTAYRHAIAQGREAEGRRDDRVPSTDRKGRGNCPYHGEHVYR